MYDLAVEQWPHESYPPFASGCGFLIAYDLVQSLVDNSPGFTFFRVIDVPVGVCLAQLPPERLRIVHLPEVRPYRPLPLFRADTIVQHYMQPEEPPQNTHTHTHTQQQQQQQQQQRMELVARSSTAYSSFVAGHSLLPSGNRG